MLKHKYVLIILPLIFVLFSGIYRINKYFSFGYITKKLTPGKQTTDSVYNDIGEKIEKKLAADFRSKGVMFPPNKLTYIIYKDEEVFEIWAEDKGRNKKIREIAMTANSGNPGPKLKSGDRQIPEGMYRLTGFNPNSRFHLSIKVNYPNAFDRKMAEDDKRSDVGGDIFIHGKSATIGCIPVGDKNIEEIFILSYLTGLENIRVIIAPNRGVKKISGISYPNWTDTLYAEINENLSRYK